jgi:tetratricopeptide (TPR) repeat protein
MAWFIGTVLEWRRVRRRLRLLACAGLLAGIVAVGFAGVRAQDAPGESTNPEADAPSIEPGPEQRFVTRFEAELEMRRLTEAQRHADAAAIGAQLVPLTEAEFGPDSIEAAAAHRALADAQSMVGEHQAAEESYLRALEIYRKAKGSFSPVLIDPLLDLGDNYHKDGQFANAISAYTEARTVSRRVDGLLNERQIEILDRMSASLEDLGQLVEAHAHQLEALRLIERNHPAASPEVFEAIYKYGAWLRSVHRYNEEREQYFKAERLIRDAYGDESVLLVRPLRERAISFRVQGAAASQGISGLRDAEAILEAQATPDPLMLAELLRDIGDWEVAFGRLGIDGADYQRSWQLLGNVPDGEQLRNAWYAGIEFVFNAPLSRRGLSDDPQAPRGRVLVRFDIDEFGRSNNVVVIASEPPGLKDEAVARHIRQSRFRPNIVEGRVVASRNKALDIIFRYVPNENEEGEEG